MNVLHAWSNAQHCILTTFCQAFINSQAHMIVDILYHIVKLKPNNENWFLMNLNQIRASGQIYVKL